MQRRILVVDDQESIQYFLRKTLESEGYQVDGVGDLAGARASFRTAAGWSCSTRSGPWNRHRRSS
jgi:CheY-like chemotaxis protein